MLSGKDVFRQKLLKFCSFQERSQKEFIQKMFELKIPKEWQDELILEFIQNNYLSEERFVRSIIRGKFRINHWGKIKIKALLKSHQIPDVLINRCMDEINETDYLECIRQQYQKKITGMHSEMDIQKKHKTVQYLLQRGFEYEQIQTAMKAVDL